MSPVLKYHDPSSGKPGPGAYNTDDSTFSMKGI